MDKKDIGRTIFLGLVVAMILRLFDWASDLFVYSITDNFQNLMESNLRFFLSSF